MTTAAPKPASENAASSATAASPVAIIHEITEEVARRSSVETVFGEPKEFAGKIIIPVARVRSGGGAGGGSGRQPGKDAGGEGAGGGIGVDVRPLGWLIVADDRVRWQPVVDFSRVVTAAAAFGLVGILAVTRTLSRALKRGRRR